MWKDGGYHFKAGLRVGIIIFVIIFVIHAQSVVLLIIPYFFYQIDKIKTSSNNCDIRPIVR